LEYFNKKKIHNGGVGKHILDFGRVKKKRKKEKKKKKKKTTTAESEKGGDRVINPINESTNIA